MNLPILSVPTRSKLLSQILRFTVTFCKELRSEANHCWLISSNPFDVIGAKNVGLKAAWIARSEQSSIFDPWGIEPDIIAKDLNELAAKLTLY